MMAAFTLDAGTDQEKLYFSGGANHVEFSAKVYSYNEAADTFERENAMELPIPLFEHVVRPIDRQRYVRMHRRSRTQRFISMTELMCCRIMLVGGRYNGYENPYAQVYDRSNSAQGTLTSTEVLKT